MRSFVMASGAVIFIASFVVGNQVNAAPDSTPFLLSQQETDMRLSDAAQSLHSQQISAEYWEYGWGAFDGGTMLWNAQRAGQEGDRKARNTDIVQAAESAIGLADVILRPLPAFHADSLCKEPFSNEQDRLQCIADRETLLELSAERANEPYEMLPHLGNAGFNLLAGLIVLRVGGAGRALTTAIPGEIIGELQLWTIPGQPLADFDHYKMQFSPLLIQTEHTGKPAPGLLFSFHF